MHVSLVLTGPLSEVIRGTPNADITRVAHRDQSIGNILEIGASPSVAGVYPLNSFARTESRNPDFHLKQPSFDQGIRYAKNLPQGDCVWFW